MSIITSEFNYQRSSHRVNLPMLVEIDDKIYSAHDWSVGGLGIIDFERTVQPEDELTAYCVLPMKESSVRLKVEICFRGTRGKVSGFSFVDLSDRNRRVFRHYIELAIDGRLDKLEDMVSIVTAPAINSPITEALTLSDIESDSLAHKFKSRSRLAISTGIAFVLVLSLTLVYNTVYKIRATGLIAGNIYRVTANYSGIIQSTHVKTDAYIDVDTPLFTIKNPQQLVKLQTLRVQLREKQAHLAALQKAAKQSRRDTLVNSLNQRLLQAKTDYQQATLLHQQHIISFKDIKYLESQLTQAQIAYNREINHSQNQHLAMLGKINAATIEVKSLKEQESILLVGAATHTARSPKPGRVLHIEQPIGTYVNSKDVVLLLETNEQPSVLIQHRHDNALKLRLGMAAEVYVPIDDRKYSAKIATIGRAAVNSAATDNMEASLSETLVKLEFDDANLRFPANARVKVWIITI